MQFAEYVRAADQYADAIQSFRELTQQVRAAADAIRPDWCPSQGSVAPTRWPHPDQVAAAVGRAEAAWKTLATLYDLAGEAEQAVLQTPTAIHAAASRATG